MKYDCTNHLQIPEILFPYKFDIYGGSHPIIHFMVI